MCAFPTSEVVQTLEKRTLGEGTVRCQSGAGKNDYAAPKG
ncbi:hypothetical protein COLSTE_00289 [Collinsella stercoris DSM 13279]|uniref:Uncharacterized protein n=1 Tax=Collinsella stercoris DSM 13279 TaxID=445975 RepID=B6G899_9ACTN|nr:hypothetical protein COLSTE_00289 [Collinsella stercoris DSM 13279]